MTIRRSLADTTFYLAVILRQIGFGNIIELENTETEGVLYELFNFEQIRKLDKKEGYPEHYDRKLMEIIIPNGNKVEAWVYITQPKYINNSLKPSKEYLRFLLEGKDYLLHNNLPAVCTSLTAFSNKKCSFIKAF